MTLAEFKSWIRRVFKVVPGGPTDRTRSRSVIDLLDAIVEDLDALRQAGGSSALLPALMDAVMALDYDNGIATTAAPTGYLPGMSFDATDPADGQNYHYYCGRPNYVPGQTQSSSGLTCYRIWKNTSDIMVYETFAGGALTY